MTVGKVLPFGARGSRNYAPPCMIPDTLKETAVDQKIKLKFSKEITIKTLSADVLQLWSFAFAC